MLTHSAFLLVTELLLMNNEIGQSILRTYTALWTSFARAQFKYSSVAFFAMLRESSKRLAIICETCMWLNGYFMSTAAAVIGHRPLPLSSAPIVYRPPLLFAATVRVIRHHCPPPSSAAVQSRDVKLEFFSKSKLESKKSIKT